MHLKSRRLFRPTALLCLAILAFGLVSSAIAQEAAAPAAAPAAAAGGEKKEKTAFAMLWDVASTPPYVFFLLIGCSIFTFTLIPERFMYYRKAGGNADEMVLKIKQAGTLSDALTAIEHAPGVAGTVIRAPPRSLARRFGPTRSSCRGCRAKKQSPAHAPPARR